MQTERIKIGVVGVDSGQLMICDPRNIALWKDVESGDNSDFAHEVYQHVATGKLWQFTYGSKPQEGVHPFPESYAAVIPEYNKTPNDLIASGEFVATKIDPRPHIPPNEFSYRAISKGIQQGKYFSTQIHNFLSLPGIAVGFSSGLGDGVYDVYAEIAQVEGWGRRIARVVIEMITDETIEELKREKEKEDADGE